MKKLRNAIEKRLPALVLILLVIQPAMDVLSYFLGQMGSNTLSTLLRFAMLAAVALLGFIVSEEKKVYFIMYGAVALFWVAHALNCFRVGYQSPVEDAANFLRILNFPIFALSFITFFRRGKELQRYIYLGIAIDFGEIVLFTALPWLMGKPVYTYASIGVGVLGWFSIPSAQSAIIVLAVPLTLFWAYRTNKYPVFLLACGLCFALMYFTGTKFTYYSIFIIAGAYAFLFLLNLGKKSWKYVLPMVLAIVMVFATRAQSPMVRRESLANISKGNYSNAVANSMQNSGADDTVLRATQDGLDAEDTTPEELEKIRRSLLGVYADKKVYGKFFQDLYERFGVYNVMEAYDYTSQATYLSDSRLRKNAFAALVWEEKDFLTRLLGFEYSDMVVGDTIYDLENDFPAVYYFTGYVGFGLYLLFFAYFVFLILRAFWRNVSHCASVRSSLQRGEKREHCVKKGLCAFFSGVKRFLTIEMGAVGMTFVLGILVAQISGNVLRRPNVTVYFAAAVACLYRLCAGKARETETAVEKEKENAT